MWNFQRIICIWICCVSCMFGTTQLSTLVQAVPYEYFDDHEQSFYDLDTEQIQAKYDARLLTQQMLQTEQQRQLHLENLKGFHNSVSGTGGTADTRKPNDGGGNVASYTATATTKLKSNDGHTLVADAANDDDDDDERSNVWLKETSTQAAALTPPITETLDELHLPRAASCFTNGQKFTHGQKVPRLDNCEVCLCMDGEIFCWWEKCDKKPTKALTTYDDYSTPFEDSSTTRIQLNSKTTNKTTLKPLQKPKTNESYKYDYDDSAEVRDMQREYNGLKEQLMQKEHEPEQRKTHYNKQMAKKKIFQQQKQQHQEEKYNKNIKEQMNNKKNRKEQQKQQKANEHIEQHHHAHYHNHNNNNNNNKNNNNRYNNHYHGSSGASSKILNFPENRPSILYYDYKTEEHHQHQRQHREQHLKHQKQKQEQQMLLKQHEKELKQQQQQQNQQHHVNRHHEYGQDFNTYSSSSSNSNSQVDKTLSSISEARKNAEVGDETQQRNATDGGSSSSTTFKYFKNGYENIYGLDLQTDSDILPEPPTKKPKFLTSLAGTTATASEKTTGIPILQFYRSGQTTTTTTTTDGTIMKSTTFPNTPPTASILLKKQIFSTWGDYNEKNRDGINNSGNGRNNNNESAEDIIDTDDQDDAFHRWLTSTETNNKRNFSLNDAIISTNANAAGGGLDVAVAASGNGLDAAANNDYNGEEKNYENIEWATDTGFSIVKTKAKGLKRPPTVTEEVTTTEINKYDGPQERVKAVGGGIYYGIFEKPNSEQHFGDNYGNNRETSNGFINGNDKNSNSNNYNNNNDISTNQNYNKNNNNNMDGPTTNTTTTTTTTSTTSSSTNSLSSNEDNGAASVVNIDIMLTASSADLQQPQQTHMETTCPQRQLQLHDFQHEKQIAKTQLKFHQPPVLISNTNEAGNNNSLYSIINNNNARNLNINSNNSNNENITNMVGDGLTIKERTQKLHRVGANLSSSNEQFSNITASNSKSLSTTGSNHISEVVWPTETTIAATITTTPPTPSTTLNPERQCNVMGTLYKIGDVLPQDTGNCLQCICIDGSTSDDTPRVTCSPHNCPPLVLPDLFDATGY